MNRTMIIENGEYVIGDSFVPLDGDENDLFAECVLICLQTRRGSFLPNPELGSRLFEIDLSDERQLPRAVLSALKAALVLVEGAEISRLSCRINGEKLTVCATVSSGNFKTEVNLDI